LYCAWLGEIVPFLSEAEGFCLRLSNEEYMYFQNSHHKSNVNIGGNLILKEALHCEQYGNNEALGPRTAYNEDDNHITEQ
jgi:hypothetical protein